jgi:hypothetical protein
MYPEARKIWSITNLHTRNEFRHGMAGCFGNGQDALFPLVDVLSSEAGTYRFPEWSFSPLFERTRARLYEALQDGQMDAEHLRKVFVEGAALPKPGFWASVRATGTAWRPRIGRGS